MKAPYKGPLTRRDGKMWKAARTLQDIADLKRLIAELDDEP